MRSQLFFTRTVNQNKHLTCLLEQFHLLLFPAVLKTCVVLALNQVSQQFIKQHSIMQIL